LRYEKQSSGQKAGTFVTGSTCTKRLARSSTSNRLERGASRELVAETLRPVPKGHWTIAGGVNHRCVTNINPSPGPGRRKSRDYIASPLPGLAVSWVRNRWFAPPAKVRDASGVRCDAVARLRPEKPGTFVTVSTWTKRLASSSL